MEKVRKDPKHNHWSQSPLEKVTDAKILLDDNNLVLVKTTFSAPKPINHITWGTEFVGKTNIDYEIEYFSTHFDHKKSMEKIRNILGKDAISLTPPGAEAQVQMRLRWANEEFKRSYSKGEFPHTDYTLWICNQRINSFVNMRLFPEESFLTDRIKAEIKLFDELGNPIVDSSGHPISNYSKDSYFSRDGTDENLCPEERTLTLDQLIKENRIREGSIILMDNGTEYEGKFMGKGKLSDFKSADGISSIPSFELPDRIIELFTVGDLKERYLNKVLIILKNYLEECNISYRKVVEDS